MLPLPINASALWGAFMGSGSIYTARPLHAAAETNPPSACLKVIHREDRFQGDPSGFSATLDYMNAPRFILPSDAEFTGQDSRILSRLCSSGCHYRIRRGVYVDTTEWLALDAPSQYGLRVTSFQLATKEPPVLCRESAALLWGLWTQGVPDELHIFTSQSAGGRSRGEIVRHLRKPKDGVVRCGPLFLTD